MMGYPVMHKKPSVTPLPVHLPATSAIVTETKSPLKHYFARPLGHFIHNAALRSFDHITYKEYYTTFRIATHDPMQDGYDNYFNENTPTNPMHVILRCGSARLHHVRPSAGDWFYLRSLLQIKPGHSFGDLLTVNGVLYNNFQAAAMAHGMFQTTDSESNYAISEAISSLYTPPQLQTLFIHLLVNDCVKTPVALWDKFNPHLCFDFTIQYRDDPNTALNKCLQHLSSMLEEYSKTLSDFGLQEPTLLSTEVEHELACWRPHAL
jgi:hypothetical protein